MMVKQLVPSAWPRGVLPRQAARWSVVLAVLSWLLCTARQIPCQRGNLNDRVRDMAEMCYTDISTLYVNRQLYVGTSPYALEYPVLTNVFVHVSRRLARLVGAQTGSTLPEPSVFRGATTFLGVIAVLLAACLLVTVLAQVAAVRTRPADAVMVAGAPTLMLAGLINWDMLVVMLTALAVWAWARRRPALCGVFIGLGVAAKLYPFLLLIPLFALCLRTGKIKQYVFTSAAAIVAWAVPNGIVYAARPAEWKVFWTFNVDRGADFGSAYYAIEILGSHVPRVSLVQSALMVIGAFGVVLLGLLAPRRPRFGQLAFLMVAWFLMVNKVYSPQYVLWLLPFVVLARPRWGTYAVWTLGEIVYYCAMWHHGHTWLATGSGLGDGPFYAAAVFVRLAVQALVVVLVIRDVFRPQHDIVRRDGVDDPTGGILDGAPDARRRGDQPGPGPARGVALTAHG